MKKIPSFLWVLPLILVFPLISCTFSHLEYPPPLDDELPELIRNVPSSESYPDAGIVYILDEGIVEVFKGGGCKQTHHVVFKILNDRGKGMGNIKIGYNSRTETTSIIHARTITPEGKVIPLNENAIKIVTPVAYRKSILAYHTSKRPFV